jgi:cytochrome c oxidase subunit III
MSDGVLQPQYADLAHQSETAELGIWGFIATEVLFLGGLFAAYSFYCYLHPAGVAAAARHTKIVIGSINTAVLLTSSFFMSWASLSARAGESRFCGRLMWLTAALGVTFVVLKGVEYAQEIGEHFMARTLFCSTDERATRRRSVLFPLLADDRDPCPPPAGRHRNRRFHCMPRQSRRIFAHLSCADPRR